MIVGFEKPPLDEALLVHFGVRGMKWGIRKKRRDEDERKSIFNKKNAKRVAIGAGVVAGAIATAYVIRKYGRTKLSSGSSQGSAVFKQEIGRLSSGTNPFIKSPPSTLYPIRPMSRAELDASTRRLAQTMGRTRYSSLMGLKTNELKMATDSAKLKAIMNNPNPRNYMSLEQIRKNLADPNYVWEL